MFFNEFLVISNKSLGLFIFVYENSDRKPRFNEHMAFVANSSFYRTKILGQAVALRCSMKKVFLEISKNSQENTCARDSFFNKAAGIACISFPIEILFQ